MASSRQPARYPGIKTLHSVLLGISYRRLYICPNGAVFLYRYQSQLECSAARLMEDLDICGTSSFSAWLANG